VNLYKGGSRTYDDESHLSDTAKKAIEWRSALATPPIADVRHELPPRYAHWPARSNTEALVGNEDTKPSAFKVALSSLPTLPAKSWYCIHFLRDNLWSVETHLSTRLRRLSITSASVLLVF
jgi:hypothetical protein